MRRLGVVVASAVFALSFLAQGGSASATYKDVEWCAEDPIVVVFGAQFKIVTAVRAQSGGFAYELHFPSNAQGRTNINWPNSKLTSTTVTPVFDQPEWSGSGPLSVSGRVLVSGAGTNDVVVTISGPSVTTATFPGTAGSAVPFSTIVSINANVQ